MNELIKAKAQSIVRTPELIAAEINSIKEQTRRVVLYNSIEIGRRLIEAKEILGHGEWGEWLEKSVDYSQRTANNLMRIFEEYGSQQLTLLDNNVKSQAFANLSYTQAVALLGIPQEEREEFVKENDIDSMSTRELQKVIKEKQELEEKLKAAEEKAELEHHSWETVSQSYEKLEKTNEKHCKNAEKLKKELEAIQSKNREEITNKEVEIENLRTHINNINNQLAKAQASGNIKEIEKFQALLTTADSELIEAKNKIVELEKQLKEKPIEVIASPEIIEKIPEEIEKELQELREKVKHPHDNENLIKFKVHFDKTVSSVKDMLGVLAEIKEVSEIEYEKYRKASAGLLNKMLERL